MSLPLCLSGRIVSGKGRGRSMGLMTANLDLDPTGKLERGVYGGLGTVITSPHRPVYKAAISCGNSPYFGDLSHDVIEVHLLDGDCNVGDTLEIEVRFYIREQRKDFNSLEELMTTIRSDIQRVRDGI